MPARRFSVMSASSVMPSLAWSASVRAPRVAATTISVTAIATINSRMLNPACCFMVPPWSLREGRYICNEVVGTLEAPLCVGHRNRDLLQVGIAKDVVDDGHLARKVAQINFRVVVGAQNPVRTRADNGVGQKRIVIRGIHHAIRSRLKQRLGPLFENPAVADVIDLSPVDEPRISRGEDALHGFLRLLL